MFLIRKDIIMKIG